MISQLYLLITTTNTSDSVFVCAVNAGASLRVGGPVCSVALPAVLWVGAAEGDAVERIVSPEKHPEGGHTPFNSDIYPQLYSVRLQAQMSPRSPIKTS